MMTTGTAIGTTTGPTRVDALLDRAEISELVQRYVVGLDTAERSEQDLQWYRRIFTDDVELAFPIGTRTGLGGLPAFQRRARLTWLVTHHVSADHVIDLDGDRATARVQLLGTHVAHGTAPTARLQDEDRFDMGGYYDITTIRRPEGWRISRLRFVVVWTSGGAQPRADGPEVP